MFGSKHERQEPAGLGPWPSVFSLAAIRHCDQKRLAEGRACLTCSPHHSPSLVETEARTQEGQGCGAEAMGEHCSLACSAFHNPGPPAMGRYHLQQAGSIHTIINQKKTPQALQ